MTPKAITRRLLVGAGIVVVAVLLLSGTGLWWSSSFLLDPRLRGSTDFDTCAEETAAYWGEACGNLRDSNRFRFTEVEIPSVNGYNMPGWYVSTAANDIGPPEGAIMLLHGGGGDRRAMTRYIGYFLERGLDVVTFDLGCAGESPCPEGGMSYGHRESRDAFSGYLYLRARYDRIFAMGSSVGAAALLTALPEMPELNGLIAENPFFDFESLIVESAAEVPQWFVQKLIGLTKARGSFDGLRNPANSLPLAAGIPVFFVHSSQDERTPLRRTRDLMELYDGPMVSWFPECGSHSAIWNWNPGEYERRLSRFLDSVHNLRS